MEENTVEKHNTAKSVLTAITDMTATLMQLVKRSNSLNWLKVNVLLFKRVTVTADPFSLKCILCRHTLFVEFYKEPIHTLPAVQTETWGGAGDCDGGAPLCVEMKYCRWGTLPRSLPPTTEQQYQWRCREKLKAKLYIDDYGTCETTRWYTHKTQEWRFKN